MRHSGWLRVISLLAISALLDSMQDERMGYGRRRGVQGAEPLGSIAIPAASHGRRDHGRARRDRSPGQAWEAPPLPARPAKIPGGGADRICALAYGSPAWSASAPHRSLA